MASTADDYDTADSASSSPKFTAAVPYSLVTTKFEDEPPATFCMLSPLHPPTRRTSSMFTLSPLHSSTRRTSSASSLSPSPYRSPSPESLCGCCRVMFGARVAKGPIVMC